MSKIPFCHTDVGTCAHVQNVQMSWFVVTGNVHCAGRQLWRLSELTRCCKQITSWSRKKIKESWWFSVEYVIFASLFFWLIMYCILGITVGIYLLNNKIPHVHTNLCMNTHEEDVLSYVFLNAVSSKTLILTWFNRILYNFFDRSRSHFWKMKCNIFMCSEFKFITFTK